MASRRGERQIAEIILKRKGRQKEKYGAIRGKEQGGRSVNLIGGKQRGDSVGGKHVPGRNMCIEARRRGGWQKKGGKRRK